MTEIGQGHGQPYHPHLHNNPAQQSHALPPSSSSSSSFVPPPLFCVPSAIVSAEAVPSSNASAISISTSSNLLPNTYPPPLLKAFPAESGGGNSYSTHRQHSITTNSNVLLSSANAPAQQHSSSTQGTASSTATLLNADKTAVVLGGLQQPNTGECDFKTCLVKMGEVTTIEIVREKLGLGLSIVGGIDTPLVSAFAAVSSFY